MPQFRKFLFVLAAITLSGTAQADDRRSPDPLAALEPQLLFQGMIREEDVTLLFDYLRHGVAAAARGDEPPPPDELQRRAEALGHEVKVRGALAALLVLNALEVRAREALREPRRPMLPPTAPHAPASH